MKIIIYQNREVYKENSKIGNDSENKVETLEFEFPEEYKDFTKYIEFQIKGEKYVDLIENNKYVITKSVAKYGKIKAQVVLKKNNSNDTEIFKSDIFTLTVSNSINATESLFNEVSIDFIEKLVSKNNEQDSRLNTLETDNTINSESISNLKIDNETNKTDILNLKQDQIILNTNISNLKKDSISNKAKTESLELKDTEQDTNIQKNTESIDSINKKDTEQDKEIEEIKTKDTNQDNLIKQLQEENRELKLENSLIKEQIPNGNIVGNSIHIEDSSNLEMSLKIKGGHRQETRSGKNILDYTKLTAFEKYSVTETQINSGIRITCNNTLNSINAKYIVTNLETYKTQKLTISANIKSNSSNKGMVLLCFCDKDGGNRTGSIYTEEKTDGRVSLTITIPEALTENTSYLCLMLYGRRDIYDDVAIGDYVDYTNIQLEVGASATDYEQYGAMPSPDYPSEIEMVGNNINLINYDSMVNGYVETTGTFATSSSLGEKRSDFIKVFPNTHYTFKIHKTIQNNKDWIGIGEYSTNDVTSFIQRNVVNNTNFTEGITYTIRTSSETQYIVVSSRNLKEGAKIKFEQGLLATSYSPYRQGSVEIDIANLDSSQTQTIILPVQQEMLEGDYIDEVEHHEWGKIVSYNGETVEAEYISTTGELTTGATVYYKLAEPLDLELTSEQKTIMEQKLNTYKNITNIDIDSELANLDVTYKKDIETYEKRISALESVVLGGE